VDAGRELANTELNSFELQEENYQREDGENKQVIQEPQESDMRRINEGSTWDMSPSAKTPAIGVVEISYKGYTVSGKIQEIRGIEISFEAVMISIPTLQIGSLPRY